MANLVGKTVGKYRIVAKLGQGGMADVYKAYQPSLERYVAIKMLRSHLVEDADFISRFKREALAIGRLRHPNIVQVFDFDSEDNLYFMAMEFIDGPSLKEELKARQTAGQPFTLPEVARIFIALGNAINYAHSRHMVHRDLKPANVMINQQGQVVLTDFGIARIFDESQYTTQSGAITGTPAYMSPEQGQGQRADERSDIYSLGVMLYEMVTDVVPYDADTPFAVVLKHISEPLPLPCLLKPDLPAAVERVILKAMSKDPDDRYQKAGDMAQALRDAVDLPQGAEYLPLTCVASAPSVEEIKLSDMPVMAARSTSAAPPGGGTLSPEETTPVQQRSAILPLIIGGVIIALLLAVIVGMIFINRLSPSTPTAEVINVVYLTGTAQANASVTAAANATAGAEAALRAPTQTAQAATAQVEATLARQTADAQLISGVFAARDATSTAEAQVTATAAAAVVATSQAQATPTPTPEATPTPTPKPTSSGGGGGVYKLVYTKWDGGQHNMYVADTNGKGEQFILGRAAGPSWSPDGQYIFFYGEQGIDRQTVNGVRYMFDGISDGLVKMNASPLPNNVGEVRLFQSLDWKQGTARWANVAPNGQMVAYDAKPGGDYRIYFLDTADNTQYKFEIQGEQADWSPDSQKIVYRSGRDGKTGIWISNRDDSGHTNITNNGSDAYPTWSPNGKTIAFSRDEGGNVDIYTMNVDGSNMKRLTDAPGPDSLPVYAPSGDIIFRSARSGSWGIWKMSGSGANQKEIIPNAGVGNDWAFSRMDVR